MKFVPSPLLFVSMSLVIGLSACSQEEFLHHRTPQPKAEVLKNHQLSQVVLGGVPVDILWIIDNSGSMDTYQAEVRQNASDFINEFSRNQYQLDWKMGLISTDPSNAPFVGFGDTPLNSKTVDPVLSFQEAVGRLGTRGDGNEMGLYPIFKHLTDHRSFLREGAYLALIWVTDAKDQSENFFQNVSVFKAQMAALKPLDKIISYGAFATSDMGCRPGNGEQPWAYKSSRYEEFLSATKSNKVYPLCQNFGSRMSEIGRDLSHKVFQAHVILESRPVVSTLRVRYLSRDLPGGPANLGGYWSYDYKLNAIRFHDTQIEGIDLDTVEVFYEIDQAKD
jgi:hypothetical protein